MATNNSTGVVEIIEIYKKLGEKISSLTNEKNDQISKIKELESRLESAREFFISQKKEIEALKEGGGNNVEGIRANIEAEIKQKFNERIAEQNKKVDELVTAKDARIKELEAEVEKLKTETNNGRVVVDDLEKLEKQFKANFNPLQAKTIMEIFRSHLENLNREIESEAVFISEPNAYADKAEATKIFNENGEVAYIPKVDKNGGCPTYQDDLPF